MPLQNFRPLIRQWFNERFAAPTEAQRFGWPAIHDRQNALVAAPTGSGKTLTAFLASLDRLLRLALAGEPMMIGDAAHAVTCSFGATSWSPESELSAEDLIRLADDALYKAKREGRNRVAVLSPPASEAHSAN